MLTCSKIPTLNRSTITRCESSLPNESRNSGLTAIHSALAKAKNAILEANARDVESVTKAAEQGQLSQSLIKRLDLSRPGKWDEMLKGILDVRDLDDPGMLKYPPRVVVKFRFKAG